MSEFYSPANRKVPIPSAQAANFIAGEEDVAQLRDPPWETLLPQRDAMLDGGAASWADIITLDTHRPVQAE